MADCEKSVDRHEITLHQVRRFHLRRVSFETASFWSFPFSILRDGDVTKKTEGADCDPRPRSFFPFPDSSSLF
jgi:hypothetical protein